MDIRYSENETKEKIFETIKCMIINRGGLDKGKNVDIKTLKDQDYVRNNLTKLDDDTYEMKVLHNSDGEDKTYDRTKIIIRFIEHKISDINHNHTFFFDFIKVYQANYKFLICDGLEKKAHKVLRRYTNFEAFEKTKLIEDYMKNLAAPQYCCVVDDTDIKHIIGNESVKILPKLHLFDPQALYFNVRKGQILRIVRKNLNIPDITYRLVE